MSATEDQTATLQTTSTSRTTVEEAVHKLSPGSLAWSTSSTDIERLLCSVGE